MNITAGLKPFKELNEEIKECLKTKDTINLSEVYGQRYLASGMEKGKRLNIYGTPGNDMACYLNGGTVEVFGNAQDGVCNTMNDGRVIIHGIAGDALGYAMRGGEIYVEGNVGYRGGIHMKEFENFRPIVVIGGKAGAFLGEYMAGGIIIVLGLDEGEPGDIIGNFCGTGIHGGVMYIRGDVPSERLAREVVVTDADEKDMEEITKYVADFCKFFDKDFDNIMKKGFKRLKAVSARPYGSIYAGV
jgi:glutamate synthase domain-containing protein 3